MDQTNIKISGFGGQGILLAGVVLGKAAMDEGKYVTWMPSYGSEMRGGTANCSVIVSYEEISSPFTPILDMLIALNKPSVEKFISDLKVDGTIISNKSIIGKIDTQGKFKLIEVDATKLAYELGDSRVTNMVMLGALIRATNILKVESLKKAIRDYFNGKPKVAELNVIAFDEGYEKVRF